MLYALTGLVVGAAATTLAAEDQQRTAVPLGARLILEAAAQGVQI